MPNSQLLSAVTAARTFPSGKPGASVAHKRVGETALGRVHRRSEMAARAFY